MAYEALLMERFAEICKSHYRAMAITIQRIWRGYWVRSRIFSYYKLKSWLEFVCIQNIHFRCYSKSHRAAQNRIETEQREEESKEWILYILFKLHHLLRTHQISGIYSLPKTRCLSDVEKMLKSLKYKDFMTFYNSCKADARQRKAKELPPFILQHCKYAAHYEREQYEHKLVHKESYIETSVPPDRLTRFELCVDESAKEPSGIKLPLSTCICTYCKKNKE